MIHKVLWLLALHLVATQAGSNTGGFVGDDAGKTGPPSFRASGVQGSTAPSGYSAGASAEPAAFVVSDQKPREECTRTPAAHVSSVRLAQMFSFAAEKGKRFHCHQSDASTEGAW